MRLVAVASVLAPLVALGLAGCLSAPQEPVSPSTDVPSPPFAFLPSVAMEQDLSAAEPNIAALPDGTLFITAPTGLQFKANAREGAAWLWRSKDGGVTWDTLRKPAAMDPVPAGPITLRPIGPFCSCDADVVTSPDGWVYYSDWWDGNYLVERSSDGGDTWESSPFTTRDAVVLLNVDRQWLVAGENGFVGLFYSHFSRASGPGSDFNRGVNAVYSTDYGATWSDPVVVLSNEAGHGHQIAHPRMLPDGSIMMPYGYVAVKSDFWRDASEIRVALSKDSGATWDHVAVAASEEGFDNLWAVQGAVDADGAMYVAWADRVDDDHMAVRVASSKDGGATWSAPVVVRGKGLNFLPWIDARGSGQVAVGWYGGDATGNPEKAEDDAEWFAYVAESFDGGATWATGLASDVPVKRGGLCPKGAACGGERDLLDYVSLVYDSNGRLHYAFAVASDEPTRDATIVHYAGAAPAGS